MQVRTTLKLTAAVTAALLLALVQPASAQTSAQTAAAAPAAQATPAATAPAPPATPASPYTGTPAAPAAGATATTGSLRGRATDPDKAVIPGLTITLTNAAGKTYTTQTTGDGTYLLPNVPPGTYTATTFLAGFSPSTQTGVKITAGSQLHLNLHLQPEVNTIVNVKADQGTTLSVSPDNSASTLTLTGKDLDALSDDPDELSDELSALAGPAAGPNGGQIYIDGFTGGQLPPKSSIREIRINQNPFSAQYDKIGFGRIEVFTKPGTDKLHGSLQLQGNDNAFNTAALVGSAPQPPYHSILFQGSLSGPLSKKASYNIGANYRVIQDNNVVNTTVTANTFVPSSTNYAPYNFVQGVFYPQTRVDLSPRLDLQLTSTNTLTARYQFDHNSQTNAGTGGNSLASAGYNSTENNNEIQLSDSQTIGTRVITETRFEYSNDSTSTTALNPLQTNSVQGAFTDYGNSTGVQSDTATHYEVQSYTSVQLRNNFIRFGGRLRYNGDDNSTTAGTFGGFTYGQTTPTYDAALNTNYAAVGYNSPTSPCYPGSDAIAKATAFPVTTLDTISVPGICNFGLTQYYNNNPLVTRHNSIGPSQFSANAGNTSASASVTDLGLYLEDDWKLRPNMTLSGGIRYETQNQIGDHHDFAPRLGFNWGIGSAKGGSPLFVLRAGYGIFYDRYGLSQVENVVRFNGSATAEHEIIVSPVTGSTAITCFTLATCTSLAGINQTTYSQASNLRTPYVMQTGIGVEHQIFKPLTVTVTYLNSRGQHQFFSQNVGTYASPIYQYASEGIYKQNQIIVQGTFRGPAGISLFGFYTYGHANGDTAGPSTFPSSSAGIKADYGRTSSDIHQRLFLGGSVPMLYNIALSPFMIVNSGAPFNITLGQDLNQDTILNDRPALGSATACAAAAANPAANPNIVVSQYGCFNKNTQSTDPRIPINYAQGPAQFAFNLRATKTFGFGPMKASASGRQQGDHGQMQPGAPPPGGGHHDHGGGDMGFGGGGTNTGHQYNLTLGAQVLNLFNVVNYTTPVGVLSSPQFGQQTKLAGNIFSTNTAVRRISLQANFTF
jgi:hypothetical protein